MLDRSGGEDFHAREHRERPKPSLGVALVIAGLVLNVIWVVALLVGAFEVARALLF